MTSTTTREELLKNLYGSHFNREIGTPYRQACYHLNILLKKLKAHEGRGDPFYLSVYDYNETARIPLRKPSPRYRYPYEEHVILDKIFFDFDLDYNNRAKEELKNRATLSSKRDFILKLLEAGRIKEPIKQAKDTARYIQDTYGGEPFLVFSGSKGCHLYIYFNPVSLEHPKETLIRMTRDLRDRGLFNFNTDEEPGLLDTSPVGDVARISRLPGSRHPDTGLYCHPFKLDYSYREIIENSQKPEPPYVEVIPGRMRSTLDKKLLELEQVVKDELELQRYQRLFSKLEPKRPRQGGAPKIKIKQPEDVLELNRWPCFDKSPYDHDLRVIIANICLWSGLSPEDTARALEVYSQDRGLMEDKHLHHPGEVEKLLQDEEHPRYIFTCRSMKTRGLCRECGGWFYLKLDLGDEFKKRINHYKNGGRGCLSCE
ncbi:MAG TPA: hypothetical protein PKI66_01660 [Methanobacteriaceae archaeon]|nr:hypothetical protein [Methanobacteriaceae archaeon]HNS24552.1 hypothetical protein [Methanobacteriaceae archaeon]